MRRMSLLVVLAAFAVIPAAPASATVFGISDQQAGTFSQPLFAPLGLKAARYVAPYDVMSDQGQLARWDAWYKAATAANVRILVSFEHSRTAGKETKTPSPKAYEKATKAFHKAYPSVKDINTWNEVNACQKNGHTERQPLGICKPSKAGVLVKFYASNRKVFKGATIIPVNVLDDKPKSAKAAVAYIKAFKKVMKKKHKALPKVWGIHNYSDTNRFSQVRTKTIMKAIGKKGDVWLLETGGQLNVFSGTDAQKQAGAAKALGCMFYIAKKQRRVKRVYIYNYNGAAPGASFDAGLVNFDGTKRLGWDVVQKRTPFAC